MVGWLCGFDSRLGHHDFGVMIIGHDDLVDLRTLIRSARWVQSPGAQPFFVAEGGGTVTVGGPSVNSWYG